VELGFATYEKLEVVGSRLRAQGYDFEIFDEDFGRSLRVVDPDGVTIQIQEIDVDVARASESALPARANRVTPGPRNVYGCQRPGFGSSQARVPGRR
jgi:hypothetical protein